MAEPGDKDAKRRFLLTASFADQEALLVPPEEPPPLDRALPTAPPLTPPSARKGPTGVALGVHRFIADPLAHPAWDEVVQRTLALGLPAWLAQVYFRLALTALFGRDAATRHDALARLTRELDPHLRPETTLVVGPARADMPAASPVASPPIPGLSLFTGLDFAEAPPDAVLSLIAALTAQAAWHAPSVQLYGPPEGEPADLPSPLDLVGATASALDHPLQRVPLPSMSAPDPRPAARLIASGLLTLELAGARRLAVEDPIEATRRLPPLVARAPIPAARLVLMHLLGRALRARHGLPAPAPDTPGLIAQVTARLASPLSTVSATALGELSALASIDDPTVLGLDLPSRYPTALATARDALRAGRAVPRWVVANTQGADRSLLCATLMGRLPSAAPNLLSALVDLAPPDLEPALHEVLRAPWPAPAAKDAARAALGRLGRLP